MTLHVFGAIVTGNGCAANNRGETEGNITTLQKILWKDQVHTTVSAEAIRWALRYYWQTCGNENDINRLWSDEKNDFSFQDPDYKAWHPERPEGQPLWDDDLLGFMDASAGGEEAENQREIPKRKAELEKKLGKNPDDEKAKKDLAKFEKAVEDLGKAREMLKRAVESGDDEAVNKIEAEIRKYRKQAKLKGTAVIRRGVLEICRAISTTSYAGDISFNAKSGEKERTSLYGTEIHATRYQYGFAMTPNRLKVQKRCLDALDGLSSLGQVGGNHGRFLFDFSPESIVLRVTEDPAPRLLYCFDEKDGIVELSQDFCRKVKAGDIPPCELFIGGRIAELSGTKELGTMKCLPGIRKTVEECKVAIRNALNLESQQ